MKKPKIYEKYPFWMILIVNILMLAVYVAGAYIMFRLSWITGSLYVVYFIFLEFSVYREGCRYCYYYDGCCAFGKGKIAAIFFKKGNPKKFCERKFKWKDFIPHILVILIPLIVGAALLISRGLHTLTLIAIIYSIFSWLFLNPIIYGKIACPHCKQGSKCCPALKFFTKTKRKK